MFYDNRFAFNDYFLLKFAIYIDDLVPDDCPATPLSSYIPAFTFTYSQFDFYSCLLCCNYYTFLSRSFTHYFTNFLNSLTLTYDLMHNPNFLITYPHVGPLINKVKKAQPAIKNKLIILVFTGTA